MIAGIGFIIAMFTSGGYLMQAVVEEKENRTMEVIVTSVTPNQLMAGKIIGDTSVGLTQLLLWILFIVIPILIGRNSFKFLQGIQLSAQTVAVMVFVLLPSFVLVAAIMATIGATVSEGAGRPANDRPGESARLDPLHAFCISDEQPKFTDFNLIVVSCLLRPR